VAQMYDRGDRVRTFAVFRDHDGELADPTEVTLRVRTPSGEIEIIGDDDITQDSVGNYHHDIDIDESGAWFYRWEGTGALVAAGESILRVRVSQFPAD
jgi:uncharacterized protein YfaS (alpha-2-macroglobulin family)